MPADGQPSSPRQRMTTMNTVTLEQIVKHPFISRLYSNSPKIDDLSESAAVRAICRLRRMRREAKQSIQNAREDVRVAGVTDSPARMPKNERELAQLKIAAAHAADLPADLAELVRQAIATKA